MKWNSQLRCVSELYGIIRKRSSTLRLCWTNLLSKPLQTAGKDMKMIHVYMNTNIRSLHLCIVECIYRHVYNCIQIHAGCAHDEIPRNAFAWEGFPVPQNGRHPPHPSKSPAKHMDRIPISGQGNISGKPEGHVDPVQRL